MWSGLVSCWTTRVNSIDITEVHCTTLLVLVVLVVLVIIVAVVALSAPPPFPL